MNPCSVIEWLAICIAAAGWVVFFMQRYDPIVPMMMILIPVGMWIAVRGLAC